MKKALLGLLVVSTLFLTTGCKKSVVGKWKSVDKENEYYLLFNEDKSCSYEMAVARLECTYEEDGTNLMILYDGTVDPITYKYRFEKEHLIIVDDTGKDNIFVKDKSKK